MSKLTPILVAALASTTAAPALAQDDDRPQMVVRHDDLNLTSVGGRERLDARVRSAIRQLCNTGQKQDLRLRAVSLECEAEAKRSVEPQLAALYNGNGAKFASDKPAVVAAP